MNQLEKRQGKQQGFTLVEVVVSFAVLAIISGALLQTFVVSTRINRKAYDTDKAIALTVHIQDSFKSDTSGSWTPVGRIPEFSASSVISSAGVTVASITTWTGMLDSNWNMTTDLATAWYECAAELTQGMPVPEEGTYFPNPDYSFALPVGFFSAPSAAAIITLEMSESGSSGNYDLELNGTGTALSTSIPIPVAGKTIVQIHNNGTIYEKDVTLNLSNIVLDTGHELEVYILDHGKTLPIKVIPIQGLCSYTVVDRNVGEQYTDWLKSTVKRLSDGAILGQANGQAYHVVKTTP